MKTKTNSTADRPPLYTVADAAEALGISESAIRNAIAEHHHIGRRNVTNTVCVFEAADIEALRQLGVGRGKGGRKKRGAA